MNTTIQTKKGKSRVANNMEKNRGVKIIAIVALVVAVAGLTLGFAAMSTVLRISSGASFKKDGANFDVVFSSSNSALELDPVKAVVTGTGEGATASDAQIDNTGLNPIITGLRARFTNNNQKVVYTFYARNVGNTAAKLTNINFKNADGEGSPKVCNAISGTHDSSVAAACNGIKLKVQVGSTSVTGSQSVESSTTIQKDQSEKIIVTIEYEGTSPVADGDFTVAFGDVELTYSEAV